MAASWLEESVEILRILINDFDNSSYTYTDNTLEQTLLAAARYVKQEINLTTDYTIDFTGGAITPDPVDDDTFLNFIILKAACLTNTWQFNTKAISDGLRARLGPADISVKGGNDIVLGLINLGFCATYEQLKQEFNFGRIGICKGILSPFRSNLYQNYNSDIGRSL